MIHVIDLWKNKPIKFIYYLLSFNFKLHCIVPIYVYYKCVKHAKKWHYIFVDATHNPGKSANAYCPNTNMHRTVSKYFASSIARKFCMTCVHFVALDKSHALWQGSCFLIRFTKIDWVGHELLTDGNGSGNSVPIISCVDLFATLKHLILHFLPTHDGQPQFY
jgi:hypothetical protein